jgi:hypothetical protein
LFQISQNKPCNSRIKTISQPVNHPILKIQKKIDEKVAVKNFTVLFLFFEEDQSHDNSRSITDIKKEEWNRILCGHLAIWL